MSEAPGIAVLLTAEEIRLRVREIGADISRDCPDGVHIIAVMTGAFVFLADLIRTLDGVVTVDFVGLASYGDDRVTSGRVELVHDPRLPIGARDVLIVEDIVDTGRTLAALHGLLRTRGPRSLRTACLLNKPSRRQVDVTVDYVGFSIEDRFVVGYGLDAAGRYRNLPYIGVLP